MSSTGTAAIHRMPGAGLLSRRRAWRTADSAEHLGWSHSTTWHTCNGMLRQTRAMTPSNLGNYMTADSHRCQTIIGFAPTAAVTPFRRAVRLVRPSRVDLLPCRDLLLAVHPLHQRRVCVHLCPHGLAVADGVHLGVLAFFVASTNVAEHDDR